ncbi:YegP family protein [Streptomyces sp. NBC_00820]|uniref:YegP family protein n=1 Tax=Streptomyces sp. NBC_00820 TaxID=2975842 RepID=UPI002ED0EFFB|nr:YegP family protein [Streptomyces sp. NBC_00820]
MTGKFEVYEDKDHKHRFRLKAGNGEIIAASQAYESRESCMKGIESVKRNAPTAPVIDQE